MIRTTGELIEFLQKNWGPDAPIQVQIRDEAEVAGVVFTTEVEIDGVNEPDEGVGTAYIKVTF